MNRLFVLRERPHFDAMVAAVSANWHDMSRAGKPLGITIAPYKQTRSNEQNALMWVRLTTISEQAWVGGRQYEPEIWHEHCRHKFLPERNAKGDEKWQYLPHIPALLQAGPSAVPARICAMSTTRLNTAEMSEYMTAMEAWAITDLGVIFT